MQDMILKSVMYKNQISIRENVEEQMCAEEIISQASHGNLEYFPLKRKNPVMRGLTALDATLRADNHKEGDDAVGETTRDLRFMRVLMSMAASRGSTAASRENTKTDWLCQNGPDGDLLVDELLDRPVGRSGSWRSR